ncbi:MAG: hypothetical protein A2817_01130 [Candidatus Yanofskybacteria bacterium RIFCSPHIGHO2_01_FULL_39_8b]|uniref:Uncharacterized protein n=1 Tax=Candidatus Yanofskybacteria bacterium RIFCSPHIGHO2_01_FULL_39_8b TaxID=1802659 RepID=A0A1F8EBV3_9BACT|nr:MAG: hypothetical protein A2817_01130 [Candidatus Yanofskybacteria bacterium RIFCSPHIGHO2_01_FULL_39_8b]
MTELQIKYDKTCACIPAGITGEEPKYNLLLNVSIQGSLLTPYKPEFQARFGDSPNTVETQVDMYAVLLEDVCRRVDIGVQELESDNSRAKEQSERLVKKMKVAYATMALSDVVPLRNGTPLFVGYLQERLGEKRPTPQAIDEVVGSYFSKLNATTVLDELGVTANLTANLKASLL